MINLNKHRIDFGKGDVGIGVIGNTSLIVLGWYAAAVAAHKL